MKREAPPGHLRNGGHAGADKPATVTRKTGGGVAIVSWSLRITVSVVIYLIVAHRRLTSTAPEFEMALRMMLSGVPSGGLGAKRPPCWPTDSNTTQLWLRGPRLGNAVDPLMTSDLARDLILIRTDGASRGGFMAPLHRTICPAESRFMTWRPLPPADVGIVDGATASSDTEESARALKDLAFRLSFLAIHEHQHRHARREAEARHYIEMRDNDYLRSSGDPGSNGNNITSPGIFDYQCPDAKFIVSYVGSDAGLGQSIRNGALVTLQAGLATDRVVLLMNGSPTGPKQVRHPWTMASCERRDLQCFFMPMSPCTITELELADAPVLGRSEVRKFGQSKELEEKYKDARVIVMAPHRRQKPNWNWGGRTAALTRLIDSLAGGGGAEGNGGTDENEKKMKSRYGLDKETMEQVARVIQESGRDDVWFMDHVAVFYIMRPNLSNQRKMEELVNKIFPPHFNPETALGLPIRSSDKCMSESECLTFDQYMRLAKSFAKKQSSSNRTLAYDTIILTTESLSILHARREYEKNETFPFRFIANDDDVAQGTGNPYEYQKMGSINVTADGIMLSTMTSLKMQLMAESTVGNCCSNFHKMMLEFLSRGCGTARINHFECLQENDNPEFRICCEWSGDEECKQKKKKGDFGKGFEKGSDVLHPDLVKKRKGEANEQTAK